MNFSRLSLFFGKALIGAFTGAIVTLLIEVFFVFTGRFSELSDSQRQMFFLVLLSGTLIGVIIACAFGGYHLKGVTKEAVVGTMVGTFAGIFVGAFLVPFLFCPVPNNRHVSPFHTKEWAECTLIGMVIGVPGGAISGLIWGILHGFSRKTE